MSEAPPAQVCWATAPGSARVPNEDYVAGAPGVVVVLDGVTRAPGTPTGCVHGTPWYVARLGTRFVAHAVNVPGRPLADALAAALADVAAEHAVGCDLTLRTTPSSTIAALRADADSVEYLVLADSTVVLDGPGGTHVVSDPANRAVAAADPGVASRALTGRLPRADVRRAALLTDGVSRFVDQFQVVDWAGLLDVLDRDGPARLIARVRDVERGDPDGVRWPRYKRHDDATAAYWVL